MKYIFLIHSAQSADPQPGTPEFGEMVAAYGTFNTEAAAAGALRDGAPLQGTQTATTVRARNGKANAVDGPFAETKEVLGVYYVLECQDLDEAIAWAGKIPTAAYGSVEERPLMERV
ncbi:MAG: YciI family protein [Alphaproteobacteria bacterium]|nr:YciI family protein [Alphaproteobacteria bacterium]